jgi:hypothetical protein
MPINIFKKKIPLQGTRSLTDDNIIEICQLYLSGKASAAILRTSKVKYFKLFFLVV